jgi:signal transduction histidine kinase
VSAAAAESARDGGPSITLRSSPVFAQIPAIYLERILTNLVENARRYAESNVEVSVRADRSFAVVEVRDDGPGVPAHERQRIFERFVRLDEARDRVQGGFGLGLAIVADLSKAFGGRVEIADPEPGRAGALFILRIPRAPSPAPERQLGYAGAV